MRNRTGIAVASILTIGVVGLAALLKIDRIAPNSMNRSAQTLDDHDHHAEPMEESDSPKATNAAFTKRNTFDCSPAFDFDYLDLSAVASALSKSSDPQHLLMAALHGKNPADETGIHAMTIALQSDPDNRLTLWNFLRSCSQFPEAAICLHSNIENQAIRVDGDNGQLWARIAGYRAKRGDMQGALDALNNAAVAPTFTDYRMEHISLFERGLAAAGNPPYRQRIIAAIGIQAAMVSNEFHTMKGCERMAPESAQWLSRCIRLGERLEHEGRSIYSATVGQRLQKNMYAIAGDDEQAALVARRKDDTIAFLQRALSKDSEVLLSRDDEMLSRHMSALAAYGEIEALALLNSEVERLKNLEGYDPCRL